jgi:hypothetical protein
MPIHAHHGAAARRLFERNHLKYLQKASIPRLRTPAPDRSPACANHFSPKILAPYAPRTLASAPAVLNAYVLHLRSKGKGMAGVLPQFAGGG